MRPDRTEAIILQTFPSRERDKLVVFLTRDRGKRKGWAYGARSMRSRFGSALEPLAKVRLVFMTKENDEAVRIESAELIRSAFPAQQNLAGSLSATYMAETADTFVQPDDPSELVYRLLDKSIDALVEGSPPEPVVAYYEIWILKLAGIFPSLRECSICQNPLELPLRYDRHGGLVCEDCSNDLSTMMPNAVADLLARLLRDRVETFALTQISRRTLFEIRAFARELRRDFLGHELKSHDLLQSVIAGR